MRMGKSLGGLNGKFRKRRNARRPRAEVAPDGESVDGDSSSSLWADPFTASTLGEELRFAGSG